MLGKSYIYLDGVTCCYLILMIFCLRLRPRPSTTGFLKVHKDVIQHRVDWSVNIEASMVEQNCHTVMSSGYVCVHLRAETLIMYLTVC